MVIVKIACAQPERARVQPAGALRTPCRTALNRRHVQCLRALVCAVTASHMPHLQSPLESGAVGFAPPSTETVRVTDHVRTCTWQDLAQQEQANAELQAFCSASIRGLGLESFKPLLLKGAVASWPAVDKWSLDWLVEHYGACSTVYALCICGATPYAHLFEVQESTPSTQHAGPHDTEGVCNASTARQP